MAPLPALQNYGHNPTHPLSEIKPTTNQDFFCSACKYRTTGKVLHCNTCNFTLHPFCHTCPTTLSSITHPPHPLRLISLSSSIAAANNHLKRLCNVCSDVIRGSYFSCSTCNFDIHPLCTQIPRQFHHPTLDQNHPLELRVPSTSCKADRLCDVCKTACEPEYCIYSCAECDVDAHCHCILGRPNNSQTQGKSIKPLSSPSTTAVRPPPVGHPQYIPAPTVVYPSHAYYDVLAANTAASFQANYYQRMANLHYQRVSYNPYGYNINLVAGPSYTAGFVPEINNGYAVVQGGSEFSGVNGGNVYDSGAGVGGGGSMDGGGSAVADSSVSSGYDWSALAEMDCSQSVYADMEYSQSALGDIG